MALMSCKLCGKAFGSDGRKVCNECMRRLEDIYSEAQHFLRNNNDADYDAKQLSDNIGVDIRDIQELVDMGWIDLKDHDGDGKNRRRIRRAQEFSGELEKMRDSEKKKQTFYGGEIYARHPRS